MTEIERYELEVEAAGREDYLSEAIREAGKIADIEADAAEHEYNYWLERLTPEERAEHEQMLARRRIEASARASAPGLCNDEDVPF